MARKTIRRRRPKYQTVKAWLCRGRLGTITVWLGERNEIEYNGTWWDRPRHDTKNHWLMISYKDLCGHRAAWTGAEFVNLFDISIDDLPALGECDQVTIEIEKEN